VGHVLAHRFDAMGDDSRSWTPAYQIVHWATDEWFQLRAVTGAGPNAYLAAQWHRSLTNPSDYLLIGQVTPTSPWEFLQSTFIMRWYMGASMAGLYSDGAGGVYAASVGYDWGCACQRADVAWREGPPGGQLRWNRTFSSTGWEVVGFPSDVQGSGSDETYVAWHDDRDTRGTPKVRALKVDGAGLPSPGWSSDGVPLATTPGAQAGAQFVSDGQGGVLAIWQDQRNTGWDLYACRILPTGEILTTGVPNGNPLCVASGDQTAAQMIPSGSGEGIAVWLDRRSGDTDIYAALVSSDGPVATDASLLAADATHDFARLAWSIVDGVGLDATVCRADDGGTWSPLARVAVDGSGVVRYDDIDVLPGARYGYRLGILEHGVERFFGEAWLTIPRLDFALEGMTPNPSGGRARIAFTLPDGAPATLELLDVTGRHVARHDVGARGAGRHVVDATTAELAPGVYVVRLTRGDATLLARAAVVR
jgi:hypothetical protein